MQKTGRASYVALDPSSGAMSAWLSGCSDIAPPQRRENWIFIDRAYVDNGEGRVYFGWELQYRKARKLEGPCDPESFVKEVRQSVETNYPAEIPAFNVAGLKDCTYRGSTDTIGHMMCPEIDRIVCMKAPRMGYDSSCTYNFVGSGLSISLVLDETIRCSW